MSLYGDPDELDKLAAELDRAAARVEEIAKQVRSKAAQALWTGAAAEAFRDEVEQRTRDCLKRADELRQAAQAMRQHAQEVRELLAKIAHFEKAAVNWFNDKIREAESLAEQAWEAVRDVAGAVVKTVDDFLPWHGWPWKPGNLPAPGHKDWLEVGKFLGGQGVYL
ncbi:hypothetical protein LI90_171 [Carbonactinospora thermoautotrophica]|uniref:Putative T7SS secretion signal domain-containing protein n=1 Tax=Carbonactinospora thermoautotrophica TaxID=1469144 RepID=A0A132ML37_9ACTN|nr:WXG100 family type VII secretion target [Carbonactinospora thermoautotrophica]KWW98548.1 hypothetical protein LI90_171 [Carbonactinospora thermoautotrophica]